MPALGVHMSTFPSVLWFCVRSIFFYAYTGFLAIPHLIGILCFTPSYYDYLRSKTPGLRAAQSPSAWFYWPAILLSLLTTAVIHLVWLSIYFCLCRCRRTREKSADTRRGGDYMMLSTGGSDDLDSPEKSDRARRLCGMFRIPDCAALNWYAQLIISLLVVLSAITNHEWSGDVRFRPALRRALADRHPRPEGYARGEKVFIAANFHNNARILPYWTQTMHDVIVYLGRDNVFVSIVESHSSDSSPELLTQFARELEERGVPHRVRVGSTQAGPRPSPFEWVPRIQFHAATRNEALEPLVATGGFDKVLFSNDVFVEPESVIELLETRGGDFDYACGLDFEEFGAYDMWVLRDRFGHIPSSMWPYFMDGAGKDAMMRDEEPVYVSTCWNGLVAFKADPLLPIHLRINRTLSTGPRRRPPPVGHPLRDEVGPSPALTQPLKFRANGEDEACFSSECFLLPYDFRRVMNMGNIWLNPRVITAYQWHHYVWFKWILREPHVRWFIQRVWNGRGMHNAVVTVGDLNGVFSWDGGDCHPWWDH